MVDTIVTRALCICAVISIFMIFNSYLLFLFKNLLWPIKVRREKENQLINHIRKILLIITNGKYINAKICLFFILSVGLILILAKPLYIAFKIKGFFIAIMMSLMPYAYIRARLKLRQINAAGEGQLLMEEFVNQYKICDFNIYETVNKCSLTLDQNTVSSKALFHLGIKLRSYNTPFELQAALNNFILNWNTTWSRMLAQNIYNAAEEKVNVLNGLDNVLEVCKSIKEEQEKKKRKGADTVVIVNILCPLFFFAAILGAKEMMGYDWRTIYNYLLEDARGLKLLISTLLVAGVNIIVFPILNEKGSV